jgi:hypothetical protein
VEVGNLIKQLDRVDKEIAKRKAIPVEPTRIKGSLAKSPRDLSVDESASLAELGVRLNELVKHADDLAQWISGDLAARPAPAAGRARKPRRFVTASSRSPSQAR